VVIEVAWFTSNPDVDYTFKSKVLPFTLNKTITPHLWITLFRDGGLDILHCVSISLMSL
jgi:hypothetical protein